MIKNKNMKLIFKGEKGNSLSDFRHRLLASIGIIFALSSVCSPSITLAIIVILLSSRLI